MSIISISAPSIKVRVVFRCDDLEPLLDLRDARKASRPAVLRSLRIILALQTRTRNTLTPWEYCVSPYQSHIHTANSGHMSSRSLIQNASQPFLVSACRIMWERNSPIQGIPKKNNQTSVSWKSLLFIFSQSIGITCDQKKLYDNPKMQFIVIILVIEDLCCGAPMTDL